MPVPQYDYIVTTPDDDSYRMAAAAWLDKEKPDDAAIYTARRNAWLEDPNKCDPEPHRSGRAELIDIQCRLAKMPIPKTGATDKVRHALKLREYALLELNKTTWADDDFGPDLAAQIRANHLFFDKDTHYMHPHFGHGFVDGGTIPLICNTDTSSIIRQLRNFRRVNIHAGSTLNPEHTDTNSNTNFFSTHITPARFLAELEYIQLPASRFSLSAIIARAGDLKTLRALTLENSRIIDEATTRRLSAAFPNTYLHFRDTMSHEEGQPIRELVQAHNDTVERLFKGNADYFNRINNERMEDRTTAAAFAKRTKSQTEPTIAARSPFAPPAHPPQRDIATVNKVPPLADKPTVIRPPSPPDLSQTIKREARPESEGDVQTSGPDQTPTIPNLPAGKRADEPTVKSQRPPEVFPPSHGLEETTASVRGMEETLTGKQPEKPLTFWQRTLGPKWGGALSRRIWGVHPDDDSKPGNTGRG